MLRAGGWKAKYGIRPCLKRSSCSKYITSIILTRGKFHSRMRLTFLKKEALSVFLLTRKGIYYVCIQTMTYKAKWTNCHIEFGFVLNLSPVFSQYVRLRLLYTVQTSQFGSPAPTVLSCRMH